MNWIFDELYDITNWTVLKLRMNIYNYCWQYINVFVFHIAVVIENWNEFKFQLFLFGLLYLNELRWQDFELWVYFIAK